MRSKHIIVLVALVAFCGFATSALAGGLAWRDHAKPYEFLFGNHFDTHQQTQLKANGELFGFLYVTPTGAFIDGLPVMEHCDENTDAKQCEVGWMLTGFPGQATFVYHDGDHPIWLVDSRGDIPQPGAPSHFHWLDGPQDASGLVEGDRYPGYFLELQALDKFYFQHSGETILIQPGTDTASHFNMAATFPGY